MTGRDLITASLRLIGALAPGESLAASEATDGLSALNMMLDSWSTERLSIPYKVREQFTLTPGTQAYTIGTGGTFNTARPLRIENALIQVTSPTPAIELQMRIVTKDQFAGIILKSVQSTIPMVLYPDGQYPLQTLNLWPVPSAANTLVLYSWKPLASIATLDTAISLPPGYERAIKYNFAIEVAPEYGKNTPAEVMAIAIESKSNIKRINSVPLYLQVDDALRAVAPVWNWRTGEPT